MLKWSLEWPYLHISFHLGICLCLGQFELIEFLLIFLHENHVGGQLGCDLFNVFHGMAMNYVFKKFRNYRC